MKWSVLRSVHPALQCFTCCDESSSFIKKTFCGFSMGRNQYWAERVYDLCVYYMTGTPEGSTESGFMEKPGMESATPGLQGIVLIHYTTGASLFQHFRSTKTSYKFVNAW